MNEINENSLNNIVGGTDITSTLINAITNIFKFLADIGTGVGSSIRRITEDNMCPLK